MSRFRASSSNSPLDSQIQAHVSAAERSLQAAVRLCRQSRKKITRGYETNRLFRVERDLGRALTALTNVGYVGMPSYRQGDPDLDPEALKAWREMFDLRKTEIKSELEPEPEEEIEFLEPEIEPEVEDA